MEGAGKKRLSFDERRRRDGLFHLSRFRLVDQRGGIAIRFQH